MDYRRCAGCTNENTLNLIIFNLPLDVAASIQANSQRIQQPESGNIFSHLPPRVATIDHSEAFLLCNNCLKMSQTNRAFIPVLPSNSASIIVLLPLEFVTPNMIVELYRTGKIIHTQPQDMFRMCLGSNLGNITFISTSNVLFSANKRKFEDIYRSYILGLESVPLNDVKQPSQFQYQQQQQQPKMESVEETGFTTASQSAFGKPGPRIKQAQYQLQSQHPVVICEPILLTGPNNGQVNRNEMVVESTQGGNEQNSTVKIEEHLSQLQKQIDEAQSQLFHQQQFQSNQNQQQINTIIEDEKSQMGKRQEYDRISLNTENSLNQINSPPSAVVENPLFADLKAEKAKFSGPTDTSNWVIPGYLLMGALPGYDLRRILESGVDIFVNLMQNDEMKEKKQRLDTYFESAVRMIREDQMEVLHAEMEKEKAIQMENDRKQRCVQNRPSSRGGNKRNDSPQSNTVDPSSIVIPRRKYVQSLDNLTYIHFPMREGSVASERDTANIVEYIAHQIIQLRRCVYVHSLDGHGRPAVICALVLARLFGATSTRVITAMQEFHRCRLVNAEFSSPASHEQKMLIYRIISDWQAQAEGTKPKTTNTFAGLRQSGNAPPNSQSSESQRNIGGSQRSTLTEASVEQAQRWIEHTGLSLLKQMSSKSIQTQQNIQQQNRPQSPQITKVGSFSGLSSSINSNISQKRSNSSGKDRISLSSSRDSNLSSVSAVARKDFPDTVNILYPQRQRPRTSFK